MQVMKDLQLEEMKITFENNTKQKKKSKCRTKTRVQVYPCCVLHFLLGNNNLPEIWW